MPHRLADPGEIGRAQMPPIIKSDLANTIGGERGNGAKKFLALYKVGIGGTQDGAKRAAAAQPALDVEQIRLHARGTKFIETCLDDARRFDERGDIASLIPGTRGRTRNRRDDRYRRIPAHGAADFGYERSDDRAAPVEVQFQIALAAGIGEPERLGHIGGEIEIAGKIGGDILSEARFEPLRIDAGGRCTFEAMRTETETERAVEPAVRHVQREF